MLSNPCHTLYMETKTIIKQQAWRGLTHEAWGIDIPVSAKKTALALRLAKSEGVATYMIAMHYALERRRTRLNYETLNQRHWQTTVSRRPQRGRHHDSWAIRERYVTGKK